MMKRTFKVTDEQARHLVLLTQRESHSGDVASMELHNELLKQYNQCEEPCHPCMCSDCPCDTPEAHKFNDCVHSNMENDGCALFPIQNCEPTGKGCYMPVALRDKMLAQYHSPVNLSGVDIGDMIKEFDNRGMVVKVRDKK